MFFFFFFLLLLLFSKRVPWSVTMETSAVCKTTRSCIQPVAVGCRSAPTQIGCSRCNLVPIGHLLRPVATCGRGKYFQLTLKTTSRHQSGSKTKYGRLTQVAHHYFLRQLRVSRKTFTFLFPSPPALF